MRNGRIFRSRRITGISLLVAMAVSLDARAEDDAVPVRLRSSAAVGPGAGGASATLTERQLNDFAALVGEDEEVALRRLLWEPSLVALAAAAAEARRARRQAGMAMTIGGFSLMGIGLLLGGVMVISGLTPDQRCPYEGGSACDSGGNDEDVRAGFLVMLVSTGVGLGLGIPGIVRLSRPSETETQALDRYSNAGRPALPAHPGARAAGITGRNLVVPVLAFDF